MPRKSNQMVVYKPKKPSTALTTLKKDVKKLKAKDKKDTVYLNYGNTGSFLLTQNVTAVHMTNTQTWISIFGTDANDGEGNKITYKGLGLDLYFRSFSEPSQVSFTVFLVTITDLIGQNFNVATGGLGLVNGFHYYNQLGQVILNKKCFKIHKRKRFTLGNNGTVLTQPSAQVQYGTEKRMYMKVSKNQVFHNPYGNWKDLQAQLDPNKNMYLLIFTNDDVSDAQSPAVDFNVVHTVQKQI